MSGLFSHLEGWKTTLPTGAPHKFDNMKLHTLSAKLADEGIRNGGDWNAITNLTGITPEEFERLKARTK
jgi:hypothetical protein